MIQTLLPQGRNIAYSSDHVNSKKGRRATSLPEEAIMFSRAYSPVRVRLASVAAIPAQFSAERTGRTITIATINQHTARIAALYRAAADSSA